MTDETKTPRTDAAATGFARILVDRKTFKTVEIIPSEDARQLERDLALVTQERDALRKKLDEAYERAAQVANEFDFGLDSQSGLVEAIRALKTEVT